MKIIGRLTWRLRLVKFAAFSPFLLLSFHPSSFYILRTWHFMIFFFTRSLILDPLSSIPYPRSPIPYPRSSILDPRSSILGPRSSILDPGFPGNPFVVALTTQRIDSSTCFAIPNNNKGLEQVKSGNKCFVTIMCMGMQGFIKTREKRVQSNYPGHIIHPWFMTHVHATTRHKVA